MHNIAHSPYTVCPSSSPHFDRSTQTKKPCLLIIQCDSGHINGDLIACARYRIYDMRAKALLNRSTCSVMTHVVFIIHLPVHVAHSTFVGFQGAPWISCHIDRLRRSDKNAFTLEVAQEASVSQLFYSGLEFPGFERQTSEVSSNMETVPFERMTSVEAMLEEAVEDAEVEEMDERELVEEITDSDESDLSAGFGEEAVESSESDEMHRERSVRSTESSSVSLGTNTFSDVYTQCVRLNSCIQSAVSRLQDTTIDKQRAAERVRLLIQVIPSNPTFPLGIIHRPT